MADLNPKRRNMIAYVGGFEPPDRNTAGLRVLANANILRELGHDVVLFGVSRELGAGTPIQKCAMPDHGFDCWNIPQPASGTAWLSRIVGRDGIDAVIREHYRDRLGAIICYDFPAIAQMRLTRLARSLGALAIAEATEWYGRSRFSSVHSLIKNLDTPARMKLVNKRMDGVMAASRFLHDYYADTVPTVQLPTVMLDLPTTVADAEVSPDDSPRRLVFAATGLEPKIVQKMEDGAKDRLSIAIEALHIALRAGSRFELDVFGASSADYLALYPTHGAMLDEMAQAVRFHGFQPREVVRDRIRRADFSIFLRAPTIATLAGFPTKYAESIHLGTPVITNAVGSLTHYHVEGQTGFYLPFDDIEAAAGELIRILDLPSAAVRELKENCLRSNLFSYRRWIEPMGRFLEEAGRHAALRRGDRSLTDRNA